VARTRSYKTEASRVALVASSGFKTRFSTILSLSFAMKTLKLVVLVAAYVLVNCEKVEKFGLQVREKSELVVAEAIKGMLTGHFAVKEPHINLVYFGKRSQALAEKLLREKPIEVTARLFGVADVDKFNVDSPTIALFDSAEHYINVSYKLANKKLRLSEDMQYPNTLFFVPKRGEIDVLAKYAEASVPLVNTNFIQIVNDTTIDLVTIFNFDSGKCGQANYRTINRFSTSNWKWENETFFPEKFNDFHGCELKVATDMSLTKEALILEVFPRSMTTEEIFSILAQKLNFRMEYVGFDQTATADLYHWQGIQSRSLYELYDFSPVLYTDKLTLTVPTGEPYTQLEKMFLMFDKDTWICIGVTIAGALLVIQVINFMSVQVQKFVFGRDVRTPTLNVASIVLTGAQHRVPGRNFARFLLMMFIVWSLIFRTCYQSILYKNLQQDLRKPRIKTLEELNERNFSILIDDNLKSLLDDEFIKRFEGFFDIR
jgi:hypothetical protein